MSSFAGKRVSTSWGVVLRAAHRAGVAIPLNSGRRTLDEQEDLVKQKGLWSPSNPTGAAAPNPNAPHIRVGREDHALDISFPGVLDFQKWLAHQGVNSHRPIAAEPWHLEVLRESDLIALAKKLRDPNAAKRAKLTAELKRIRSVIRERFHGRWSKSPARKRRAESITEWLRKHRKR